MARRYKLNTTETCLLDELRAMSEEDFATWQRTPHPFDPNVNVARVWLTLDAERETPPPAPSKKRRAARARPANLSPAARHDLEHVFGSAWSHGDQSEPDHEIGDLQAFIYTLAKLAGSEVVQQAVVEYFEVQEDWTEG